MSKWEMVKLGEVCDILNGYAFKSENYVDSGIRIIRITNVQKGYIEDNQPEFYALSETEKIKKYKLYENDLLISLTGNVGRVALLNEKFLPAALNQRVGCIRIKNMLKLNKWYLFSFLNSNLFEKHCIESSKGVAQKNMSTEWLKDYAFPIPPLETQKKIADELDKITALIEKRKSQIEKLDLLTKSKFVEMFGDPVVNPMGWEVSSIESLCEKIVDCPHSTPNYLDLDTGYRCIRTTFIKKNMILWNKVEFISQEEYIERTKRKMPRLGDVVYSREGAILGIAARINIDYKVALGQRLMLLSPNELSCNSFFLSYAMNFDTFLKKALEKIGGSASPHINVKDIKEFKIIAPPLALQNKFAQYVEQIENTRYNMEKGLAQLETLYKQRMQNYFA